MPNKLKTTPPTAAQLKNSQELRKDLGVLQRSIDDSANSGSLSTDDPESDLGIRLDFQRRAKGLTQSQLAALTKQADKAGKGLSRSVISLYELGINRPSTKEIRLLCEALKVSPSYLIYGNDDPFGNKASSFHFGGIAASEPEFLSRAVYCLYRLDAEHSIALVQIMMGILRSELKGFDGLLEFHADHLFLDTAEALRSILETRNSVKKP